jgi:hypothetical protein
MTDQPDWDIPIPELDADGQPVTPEVQDAIAELTPELPGSRHATPTTLTADRGRGGADKTHNATDLPLRSFFPRFRLSTFGVQGFRWYGWP